MIKKYIKLNVRGFRDMVYCEECGAELKNNDKFCDKCGTKVKNRKIKTKHCPECGEKISYDEEICSKCKNKKIN